MRLKKFQGLFFFVVGGAVILLLLVADPNEATHQQIPNSQNTTMLLPENTAQYHESAPVINKTPTVPLFLVTKVVDGDTIKVDMEGKNETVRLIGMDTPESVDPRRPVQCFGKEASGYAKNLLNEKYVKLQSDPTQGDRDTYKRLLRYIFLEDGTNVNELLIRNGFAHEYTYRVPYAYQKEFKGAEREARNAKRGLWADGACK